MCYALKLGLQMVNVQIFLAPEPMTLEYQNLGYKRFQHGQQHIKKNHQNLRL